MTSCFSAVLECFQGPSYSTTASYAQLKDPSHGVRLDTQNLGSNVVVVKNGHRICGTGGAMGTAPLLQDKAYFEVKLQQTGAWGLGLAQRGADLNKLPLGDCAHTWILRHDGKVYHEGAVVASLAQNADEGDVIGVAFDHVDAKFCRNGEPLDLTVGGVKGTVYPVVYVDDGAILDVQFDAFWFDPPRGFEEIMVEKTIL